jgi:hypothetical protein
MLWAENWRRSDSNLQSSATPRLQVEGVSGRRALPNTTQAARIEGIGQCSGEALAREHDTANALAHPIKICRQ